MKKILTLFATYIICQNTFSQAPSLQQKLYYTAKVWGFVKYYHSNVNTCNVNWDSILLVTLPAVENASTGEEFNDALDTMLAAAGPMELSNTYFPDTLPLDLKQNRDFSWLNDTVLRSDVQVQLDTIKSNFRPHNICWVQNDNNPNGSSWLLFPGDSVELNVNTYANYPDENHRLLMFIKYWNLVRYFYPHNYILDVPWDTSLYNYVLPVANVANSLSLYYLYEKITSGLQDAHVEGLTASYYYFQQPGFYQPYLRLEYADSEYVVIGSLETGIYPGEAIISVNGLSPSQWEDSLRPFYSAGNISVFRRFMCNNMLSIETDGRTEKLVIEDSTGAYDTVQLKCYSPYDNQSFFYNFLYPSDSLDSITWTTLPCDIGYVNIGNIQDATVEEMYSDLKGKSAIIFDIRNYPFDNSPWDIANLIYPYPMGFAKLTVPDVTYPGTYYWYYDSLGQTNPDPYIGKIIILMNEQTQSEAEYSCMILGAMSGAIKIGSQTAGADGDVSEWNLSQDLYTGFTTLGVFYPNGDSTQRIGIVPDITVYPTKEGILHHDDQVLDKALEVAGCVTSIKNVHATSIMVFPNPSNGQFNLSLNSGNFTALKLFNTLGQEVYTQQFDTNMQYQNLQINIPGLSSGIYVLQLINPQGNISKRMVVQR